MRRSSAAVHSRLIQFKNVQKHYFDLWALKKFLTNFAVIQAAGVSKSVKIIWQYHLVGLEFSNIVSET